MNLIPYPNGSYKKETEYTPISPTLQVNCTPQESAPAELLQNRLAHFNIANLQVNEPINEQCMQINLTKTETAPPKNGWYSLRISANTIQVIYANEHGLNNALVSVFHLLREGWGNNKQLALLEFEDWPRYSHRGLHLDTARHFFTVDEIEKIIEQIALLKMNVLHWHFADDQAWRIQSTAYPKLTESCNGQFYTQSDVRRIVAFALRRGIQIIPEFEIPGHSTAAVSAYPHLCCRGEKIEIPETGGIFPFIMCAGKNETYTFIAAIINELCNLFPGEFIHLGGDEAPKSEWEKCPHCAEKLKQTQAANFHDLQAHMLNFANMELKKQGKKSICWNDCLKADSLDTDITVQYWIELARKSYGHKSIAQNRPVIFSNVFPLYFDYPYCLFNLQKIYGYKPYIRGKPPTDTFNIVGVECAVWTERIETNKQLEYMLFPRIAAVAEFAWTTEKNYESFRARLQAYYTVFSHCNVFAATMAQAEIHGFKKFTEKMKFFFSMTKSLRQMSKANKQMRRNTQ